MSEENRFTKNKKITIAVVLIGIILGTSTGVMVGLYINESNRYTDLTGDYDELYTDYLELLDDFNSLDNQYFILTGEHIELENDFNDLLNEFNTLQTSKELLQTQYNNLLIDFTTLSDDYDDLDLLYNILQMDFNELKDSKDTLQLLYDNLSEDYSILEDDYTTLLSTYNTLQTDYIIILSNFNELLGNYTILSSDYNALQDILDELQTNFNLLQIDYDNLFTDYGILEGNYNNLINDYDILSSTLNELQITLDALQIAYNYICDTIRQSILPVQYIIFAEAVRRYYIPIYMGNLFGMQYWKAYTKFCRDMILHDSGQYNAFSEVSNAFSDALVFGNDTMYLADYIMNQTFYPWLPNWDGFDLTGNELIDLNDTIQWCIDEIDYEYDDDITDGQEYFEWDYIKFPVETVFRRSGDCEDQAILCATYLESCGFETVIAISHDQYYPNGAFYHGSLLVHIEDTDAFLDLYGYENLWRFTNDPYYPEFTWSWLDTTWDVPFGSTPPWLQYYIGLPFGFPLNTITLGVCDINGVIIQI